MTALTQTADVAIPELKNLQQRLLVAGVVGAAVSAIGFLLWCGLPHHSVICSGCVHAW